MGAVLLCGWFSFYEGEVTAGDELALRRVQETLHRIRVPYDTVWSRGFKPDAPHLENVDPRAYRVLIFVCGPLHGPQIEQLHRRFARCLRVAVGTSIVDPQAPAVTGFHHILARCGGEGPPAVDLAASAPLAARPPLVGVILTRGQQEYGTRRRHGEVAASVTRWLAGKHAARLPLDTRLARDDPHHFETSEQLDAALAALDLVVTDRLHGMVLALRAGRPALAVDPVHGGAKVTAQARACGWPAVVPAERAAPAELDRWWDWCLTDGRTHAEEHRRRFLQAPDTRLTGALTRLLSGDRE